jgi:predicted kinase
MRQIYNDRCQKLIDLFDTYKAAVRIVYVESPYEKVLRQNQSRKQAVPPVVVQCLTEHLGLYPDLPKRIE